MSASDGDATPPRSRAQFAILTRQHVFVHSRVADSAGALKQREQREQRGDGEGPHRCLVLYTGGATGCTLAAAALRAIGGRARVLLCAYFARLAAAARSGGGMAQYS
jgi:hypothetical protein